MLFLLFIPLALAPHLTDALDLGISRQMGGWDIFSYMLFLIYGYLLVANPRIIETLRKYSFVTISAATLLTTFWLVIKYALLDNPDAGFFFSAEYEPMICWLWILSVLGLGKRYLDTNSKTLNYTNEAVLPFYILHQPIILSIGYFIVQWTIPVLAKYVIVVGISFIAIMVIYELLVRRINVLRFLFGMRWTKKVKTIPAETK